MKVLAFGASLRKGSHNQQLAAAVAAILRDAGAEVDLAPVCSGKTEGEAARRQQEISRGLEDETLIQPQSA